MARPMTLETMRDEVYARLGEQAGFYTDTQINLWLNDGMDDIALRLEPKVTSAVIDTTNDVAEYELPDNLISIKTALYYDLANTTWRDLEEISYLELIRRNPSWENDTVPLIPTHWYWRVDRVVGVYPTPETGTTDGLRIIYTCRPDEMDEDTDVTTLWDWLDRVIVLYAVYRARLKDRDDQRALVARAEWERQVDQASLLINKHRKEHAPRLEPKQKGYRSAWYNRVPKFRAQSR